MPNAALTPSPLVPSRVPKRCRDNHPRTSSAQTRFCMTEFWKATVTKVTVDDDRATARTAVEGLSTAQIEVDQSHGDWKISGF